MAINNLYQVSRLTLMLLVSFIIPSVSLAADSTTSRDPQPIDTTKPVEIIKPVTETRPVEEVKPIEETKPVETTDQTESSETEKVPPQAQVCPPLCGEPLGSPGPFIPNYDTSTGILSIPAVSVDNSATSIFSVEMNKEPGRELIFTATKVVPLDVALTILPVAIATLDKQSNQFNLKFDEEEFSKRYNQYSTQQKKDGAKIESIDNYKKIIEEKTLNRLSILFPDNDVISDIPGVSVTFEFEVYGVLVKVTISW
jgi:hypothetical protein